MVTKILQKVLFFKGLSLKEIKQILAIAHIKRYKSGEIIFMKEDIGSQFFIVKSGKIKIFTSIGTEKRKTFAFLKKGDFFGEMSLLGGKVRSASAQAVEETELFVISKHNFKKLILERPEFAIKLLQTLVDRLYRSDKEVSSMLFHNILGRLADTIIELTQDKHTGPLTMAIDQNELAEYMGTTRVPVCRAINTLKRSGVIDYKRGELTVLNIKKLRSIAGSSL